MDLKFSAEDEAFRVEVRDWIADNLPAGVKDSYGAVLGRGSEEDGDAWRASLSEKGWLCYYWPKEHGGPDWTQAQHSIFRHELGEQGAPNPGMGVSMVGPLLMEFGTDAQKAEFLPKIVSGEHVWCQGYSEPEAGSDLAGLGLRAERDGDNYIVNGQKVWTSNANAADMIFFLARTMPRGEKKQVGISFIVAAMDTPGIRIERIPQISGDAEFYETFFTDAVVPTSNLIGRENEGWNIAKRLLAHERGGFTGAAFQKTLARLIELAKRKGATGTAPIDDPSVRRRLAEFSMELDAMGATSLRALTQFLRGQMPGPESSILKLYGSELYQKICDLAMEIMGPSGQIWREPGFEKGDGTWPVCAVSSRAYTIFSGTSEIQRNIIAERVLGMPRR